MPVARFLPPRLIPPSALINLRNHRKILTVDGRLAFTGGMNIGDRHLAERESNPRRVVDAQFRLAGPVAQEIETVFLEDWGFTTGAYDQRWPQPVPEAGHAICRTVPDGPNEDMDRLATILIGAVSAARHRVWVMTPYFLPPRELLAALQGAALRGVDVLVILPQKNNLPYVHRAARNMLWEVLQWGVEVRYQPGPFVHTKLLVIDDYYAQVGSSNLDPRSLRLNFELIAEVYDSDFVAQVAAHIEQVRARSRRVTLEEVDERPLPARLGDALCWLFSPYL